ncbi:MAG: sulfatase-like hydrolase/transferase, partial [bacterium]|nr:sulfatase-like hydrolase/transferase [bacterium]
PQMLSKAGYTSAIIGKWHLGDAPRFHPLRRGFDEFFGFVGGGHNFLDIPAAELEEFPYGPKDHERVEYAIPLHRNHEEITVTDYLTDAFSNEAVAFLERNRSEPFFLYLSYNAPHIPLQAPQHYIDRVASIPDRQRRMCAAMMAAVDDGVGLVMAKLRELDLDSRTL